MSVHSRDRSAVRGHHPIELNRITGFASLLDHDLFREPVPTFRDHVLTWRGAALRFAAIGVLAALAQGCSAMTAAPLGGPDPSDPAVPVAAVGYRSTVGSYVRQRPVEPRSWREQNERVAPPAKQ